MRCSALQIAAGSANLKVGNGCKFLKVTRTAECVWLSVVRKIPLPVVAPASSCNAPTVVDAAKKLQVNAAQTFGLEICSKVQVMLRVIKSGGVCNQRDGGPRLGGPHTE